MVSKRAITFLGCLSHSVLLWVLYVRESSCCSSTTKICNSYVCYKQLLFLSLAFSSTCYAITLYLNLVAIVVAMGVGDDDIIPYIRGFHPRNLVVSKRAITFLGCLSQCSRVFNFSKTIEV